MPRTSFDSVPLQLVRLQWHSFSCDCWVQCPKYPRNTTFMMAFYILCVQNCTQDGFYFKDLIWYRGLMLGERENIALGECLSENVNLRYLSTRSP